MSANTEKCADKDKAVCDYNELRRLRYFHGMLLDDKDFQSEQQYHAGKRRLLNRMLHGSGVVCGLDLTSKKDARWIEVSSGFALDCSGNEIWVSKKKSIDLASLLPPKEKSKAPECRDDKDVGDVKTYYIGIRYEERPTNPVSVYLPSATCEERTCENSRYKEGFCIEVVDCCPEPYPNGLIKNLCDCEKGKAPDDPSQLCYDCGEKPKDSGTAMQTWCKCVHLGELCEQTVPCPDCCPCDKPCNVVLGQIKVKDGKIQSICMNECRRYVLTGRTVQQLLLSVFAGSEEFFYANVNGQKVNIPNVGELVNNPFKALCWAVQNLKQLGPALEGLLAQGGVLRKPCVEGQPAQPEQDPNVILKNFGERIQRLQADQIVLAQKLGVSNIALQESNLVANPGAVETTTGTVKETTEKTKPQKPPKE